MYIVQCRSRRLFIELFMVFKLKINGSVYYDFQISTTCDRDALLQLSAIYEYLEHNKEARNLPYLVDIHFSMIL